MNRSWVIGAIIAIPVVLADTQGVFQSMNEVIDFLMMILLLMLMYYMGKFLLMEDAPPSGTPPSPGAAPANNGIADLLDAVGLHGPARKFRVLTRIYSPDDAWADIERQKDALIDMANVAEETLNEVKWEVWSERWLEKLYSDSPNRPATPHPSFPWNDHTVLKKPQNKAFMIATFRQMVVASAMKNAGYVFHELTIRSITADIVNRIAELKRIENSVPAAEKAEFVKIIGKLTRFERDIPALIEQFRTLDRHLLLELPENVYKAAVSSHAALRAVPTPAGAGGVPHQKARAKKLVDDIITPLLRTCEDCKDQAKVYINELTR